MVEQRERTSARRAAAAAPVATRPLRTDADRQLARDRVLFWAGRLGARRASARTHRPTLTR
jgi:hypothetical protein